MADFQNARYVECGNCTTAKGLKGNRNGVSIQTTVPSLAGAPMIVNVMRCMNCDTTPCEKCGNRTMNVKQAHCPSCGTRLLPRK